MTDSAKLDLLLSEMQDMRGEMQSIKADTQELKGEMQDMKGEMQDMKGEMQDMKGEMQDMKGEMQGLKGEMQELEERVSNVEQKVTKTNLVLENEIRVNIQRVAEGHLDLSRRLHEAIAIDHEKEMLSIRVNVLECELGKVKDRLAGIA